jgi:antitoxin (DNA-binding transcriptional repressor) of toxin-antitoxin stability system
MKELTYSVREFQARLGEALRAARRGDRVRIIAGGAPPLLLVAEGSAPPRRETADERVLKRRAARGKIRLARPGCLRPFRPFDLAGVSDQVRADRR